MATQVRLQGDEVAAVYDDRWRCIYEALGELTVRRATDVEFDHTTGEWEARHILNGLVIARGRNRAEVIRQEVEWLENEEEVQE